MNGLFKTIKTLATKAIDWLAGEVEEFAEPCIEYDAYGRLLCNPVYVPVGTEVCWIRCDRHGNAIPNNIPSRLY